MLSMMENSGMGQNAKKDGHSTMPSMYAIKSLNNNCPLTEDKEEK